jgi:hypothetical protein
VIPEDAAGDPAPATAPLPAQRFTHDLTDIGKLKTE